MMKTISVLFACIWLFSCAGAEFPDQNSRAYWDEICKFDYDSWVEYKIGSPDHQFCIELLESGIEPDEDFHNGDGGDNN